MRKIHQLNGEWSFQIDQEDCGETNGWFDQGLPNPSSVQVLHIWQTINSLVQYCGTAWYEKHFSLDSAPSDKRIFLCFEAVDYHTMVWLNGNYIGEHEGGFLPFEFDVT